MPNHHSWNRLTTITLKTLRNVAPSFARPFLYGQLWNQWELALDHISTGEVSLEDLAKYTPLRLELGRERPRVTWLKTGLLSLSEPFFEQCVFRSWCNDLSPQFAYTDANQLNTFSQAQPGLQPRGFIMHLSRCGSTLVSNVLAAASQSLVISEPVILNMLLAAPEEALPAPNRVDICRSLVSVLGRPSTAVQKFLFVKLSSWNILFRDRIKAAFPRVRWMFLYRNPVEVAVSNLADKSGWMGMRKNATLVQKYLGVEQPERLSDHEFCARSIGLFCEAALEAIDEYCLLLNYNEILNGSFLSKIISFFGLEVSDADLARMVERQRIYSKDPEQRRSFADDRASKRNCASDDLKKLIHSYAMPAYNKLESLRAGAHQFRRRIS